MCSPGLLLAFTFKVAKQLAIKRNIASLHLQKLKEQQRNKTSNLTISHWTQWNSWDVTERIACGRGIGVYPGAAAVASRTVSPARTLTKALSYHSGTPPACITISLIYMYCTSLALCSNSCAPVFLFPNQIFYFLKGAKYPSSVSWWHGLSFSNFLCS